MGDQAPRVFYNANYTYPMEGQTIHNAGGKNPTHRTSKPFDLEVGSPSKKDTFVRLNPVNVRDGGRVELDRANNPNSEHRHDIVYANTLHK